MFYSENRFCIYYIIVFHYNVLQCFINEIATWRDVSHYDDIREGCKKLFHLLHFLTCLLYCSKEYFDMSYQSICLQFIFVLFD